jgi:hypothetical protein
MAILSVEFKTSEDVKLLASIDPVIPKGNPGKVLAGSVAIGCLVAGIPDTGPHDRHAAIELCFAAPLKQESVIKFYDKEAGTWTSVETTVRDGQACATVNYSGEYVLVKK